MKAKELTRKIFLTEYVDKGKTVDRIFVGDGEREVSRVATCMVITPDVLRAALEWGAELILTHEPTFRGDAEEYHDYAPYRFKRELFEKNGTVVCRWHDSPHYGDVDYVSLALVNRVPWKGSFDGKFSFVLDEPLSPTEIARDIGEALGVKHPRIAGRTDGEVRKIGIHLGQRGTAVFLGMLDNDVDLAIAGELCEWQACEPVRDMAQLGMQKTLIVLGHAVSERLAMLDLADRINTELSSEGVEAKYFDCGDIYSYAD